MSTTAKARQLAETWMGATLPAIVTGAGGTGVYRHPAPSDAVEPFVTVNLMGGRTVRPLGRGNTGVEILRYDVSAWDKSLSADASFALAEAVSAALELDGPVTVAGGQIVASKRTGASTAPFTSIEGGETFQRNGSIFELVVKVD